MPGGGATAGLGGALGRGGGVFTGDTTGLATGSAGLTGSAGVAGPSLGGCVPRRSAPGGGGTRKPGSGPAPDGRIDGTLLVSGIVTVLGPTLAGAGAPAGAAVVLAGSDVTGASVSCVPVAGTSPFAGAAWRGSGVAVSAVNRPSMSRSPSLKRLSASSSLIASSVTGGSTSADAALSRLPPSSASLIARVRRPPRSSRP